MVHVLHRQLTLRQTQSTSKTSKHSSSLFGKTINDNSKYCGLGSTGYITQAESDNTIHMNKQNIMMVDDLHVPVTSPEL